MQIILRGWLKLTYLIHDPGNLSYECKVLNDFGSSYIKGMPTNERRQDPEFRKILKTLIEPFYGTTYS